MPSAAILDPSSRESKSRTMTRTPRPTPLTTILVMAGLAAVLGFADPAGATTYYVSPSGSDANSGTSPSSAWATIGKANATLRAGDVVQVAAGSYSGTIQPANAGASVGNRVTYIGNPADPASVTVGGISIGKSYVTVKGFSTGGGGTLSYPAVSDSLTNCVFNGLAVQGVKNCMIARNTINGQVHFTQNNGSAVYDHGVYDGVGICNSDSDTLRSNVIAIGTVQYGQRAFTLQGFTQHCLIDSNRVSALMTPTGPTLDSETILISYNSYYNTFRDNRWDIEATGNHPQDNFRVLTMRDSTHDFVWQRDSIFTGVQSGYRVNIMLANSGQWPGTVNSNTFDGCFIKLASGMVFTEDKARSITIQNTTIATGDYCLYLINGQSDITLSHNTFFTTGGENIRALQAPSGPFRMSSNIFYSQNPGAVGTNGCQIGWIGGTGGQVTSDNNLFFAPVYSSSPGDRSIEWCCYTASKPGTGQPWYNYNGQDGSSRYGSPRFADSTLTTFDPRLLSGSLAVGIGAGGSNAGIQTGPDVTAPAAITDLDSLMTTDKSVVLKWTGTGDDGMVGRPVAYDLRMSTAPITGTNFTSATPVLPSPSTTMAGTAMSYFVQGLTAGMTYYFAIRAVDEAGNWSGLSNVRLVAVHATDTIAPARVGDLK